jgi:hypothetical protein
MLRGEVFLGNTELRVDGRGAKDKLSQTPQSANDKTTAAVTDDQHGRITMVMFILPWGSSLALALSVVLAKNFIGLLFQNESGVRKTPPLPYKDSVRFQMGLRGY